MKFSTASLAVGAVSGLVAPALAKSGPVMVSYIEVTEQPWGSMGDYTLSDGSNAFDIAILFAANINADGTTATLAYNPNVTEVLDNASSQIQPLQAKGIKVLVSLLGNHEGTGVSNFASQDDAVAFANEVAGAVAQYGLDGVDIDDEYSDYGTNGTPGTNSDSIGWFIGGLRSAMPNSLITFYNYGPAADTLASDDSSVGSQLSYSWNAIYSTYQAPSIPGLSNAQLSPAAVDFGSTDQGTASSMASQTVSDGYGAYMTYNLPAGDQSGYVSAITQALYGLTASYTG